MKGHVLRATSRLIGASSGRSHLLTGHPSQSRPGEDDKFGLPHNVGEIPEESTGGVLCKKRKDSSAGK